MKVKTITSLTKDDFDHAVNLFLSMHTVTSINFVPHNGLTNYIAHIVFDDNRKNQLYEDLSIEQKEQM